MTTLNTINRRSFLTAAGAAFAAPSFLPGLRAQSLNGKVRHVSFGAGGMARADLNTISGHKAVEVFAVVDVDKRSWPDIKSAFPKAKLFQDWRELMAAEAGNFDSANVSTPDHMHGPIGAALAAAGKHVYGQKPLTHNLRECRHLATLVRKQGVMSQMGIQVSSDFNERYCQALIKAGAIGKVKEVYSFSFKDWGDMSPVPQSKDAVPEGLSWDLWLGPAAERDFINGYYHPGNWRKRRDFGTGTLGDMGCHMFSGWYRALDLTAPLSVKSTGPAPNRDNWAINGKVEYIFPGTAYTEGKEVKVTWFDGPKSRPPAELEKEFGGVSIPGEGSIFTGTDGIMLFPHGGRPLCYQNGQAKEVKFPKLEPRNHWHEFVDCILTGKNKPSANFDYAGPLTEAVLLGCLASVFPGEELKWDAAALKFTGHDAATALVGRSYRKGWEIPNLA